MEYILEKIRITFILEVFYDKNVNGYVFQFTDKAPDFVETKINIFIKNIEMTSTKVNQGDYLFFVH